jgi:anti-sigma28 factor (negative regulator of flagellin synthesis)
MSETQQETPKKKRSLTELTLGWIADRLRKSEELKASIESGKYNVDSKKVAERIINGE